MGVIYTEHSDEGLVALVKNGDHEAFSVLVNRHTSRFYAAAYRIVGNQDDAEDVVQDAFLKFWDRPEIWQEGRGAKFTTWFYRIVTNQALDHMRRRKKTTGSDTIERMSDDSANQLEALEMNEEQQLLEEAIDALPDRQKAALNLCFYEGLSNKDAADVLGVGVKALESLLMRAKRGVKDTLMRDGKLSRADDGVKEKTYG